jgi:hypothetical protein
MPLSAIWLKNAKKLMNKLVLQEKLNNILEKIDNFPFSSTQKNQLKEKIFELLKKAILPIMVKHMPKDKLQKFIDEPEHTTIDQYGELFADALDDKSTMPELLKLMDQILDGISATLNKSV